MKSMFFDRVGAYIIDSIIIGLIAIIVGFGVNTNTNNEIEEQATELYKQYSTNEITFSEYLDGYAPLMYESQKANMLDTGISLAITIAYFIIFQYMNKGQTIGKKLLKISVVDKDTKKPASMLKGIIRSIIFLGIASTSLNMIFINILNVNSYLIFNIAVTMIELIFLVTTIVFMIRREDNRGLHDLMANTIVIKEGK